MTFRIAFYKGSNKDGVIANLCDRFIRFWDKGPYVHCELVFNDGTTASATVADGVRINHRDMLLNEWDFITLPSSLETEAREWFESHVGKSYDYLGDAHFIFDFLPVSRDKWFCSSACAAALGFDEAWRYSPNTLYSAVRKLVKAS